MKAKEEKQENYKINPIICPTANWSLEKRTEKEVIKITIQENVAEVKGTSPKWKGSPSVNTSEWAKISNKEYNSEILEHRDKKKIINAEGEKEKGKKIQGQASEWSLDTLMVLL